MAVITIIGAGMMGSALVFPAKENGNEVRLVGTHLDREIIENCIKEHKHPKLEIRFPEGVSYYHVEEMEQAISGCDFVIGGVSSFGVDWFAEYVLPKLPDGMKILTVTKGLLDKEDGRLQTYPAFWKEQAAKLGKTFSFNAIGGPCTSYELVARDQTEVTFCGDNFDDLAFMKKAMETSYYHISLSNDVTGIETAVALKNGFALGIALTIGLNQKRFGKESDLHFNSQAGVFGQAVKEMVRIFELQNCYSLHNLAVGAGDLYVTVYGGRTRLVGILLGRGLNIDEAKAELNGVTLESLVVAVRVARVIRMQIEKGMLKKEDFPLLLHIDSVISEKKPAELPWEAFTAIEKI